MTTTRHFIDDSTTMAYEAATIHSSLVAESVYLCRLTGPDDLWHRPGMHGGYWTVEVAVPAAQV